MPEPELLGCLTCREKIAVNRGMCYRCLSRARLRIAAGETTWAAIEALCLSRPAKRKSLGELPRKMGLTPRREQQ